MFAYAPQSSQINSSITSTSNKKITTTYCEPVELSSGNISAYLIDNYGKSILRQTVNSISSDGYCTISDDRLTVSIEITKAPLVYLKANVMLKLAKNIKSPY